MNKFFLIAFALILGFFQSQAQTMQFEGTIPGVQDGTKVTHAYLNDDNEKEEAGTAVVKSGKFVLKLPKVPFQTANFIEIEGVPGQMLFVNENENIKATIFKDSLYSSYIDGRSNTIIREFTYYMIDASQRLLDMSSKYSQDQLQDPKVRKELASQQSLIRAEFNNYYTNLVNKHPDSFGTLLILTDLINDQTFTLSEAKAFFNKLSDNVKSTGLGKVYKDLFANVDKASVGNRAPDFTSFTPEGKELSLSQVLAQEGNYTLIEFWASWCPYCRQEMPNVVSLYNKYKSKGLKVLAVSFDTEKSDWVEAIETFGAHWNNVSRLMRWDDPIVQQYEVHSIPNNFLLDENGNIIAVKLKGKALEQKLKELMGE